MTDEPITISTGTHKVYTSDTVETLKKRLGVDSDIARLLMQLHRRECESMNETLAAKRERDEVLDRAGARDSELAVLRSAIRVIDRLSRRMSLD